MHTPDSPHRPKTPQRETALGQDENLFRQLAESIRGVFFLTDPAGRETDTVMPEMGGMEMFEALKEIDPGVRVVVMTGYSPGMEKKAHLIREAAGFLEKPLDVARVAQTISTAMMQKA